MLETMCKRTVMLTEQLPKFPSLYITGDAITPQGSFAEAQAKYLAPDAAQVDALVQVTPPCCIQWGSESFARSYAQSHSWCMLLCWCFQRLQQ